MNDPLIKHRRTHRHPHMAHERSFHECTIYGSIVVSWYVKQQIKFYFIYVKSIIVKRQVSVLLRHIICKTRSYFFAWEITSLLRINLINAQNQRFLPQIFVSRNKPMIGRPRYSDILYGVAFCWTLTYVESRVTDDQIHDRHWGSDCEARRNSIYAPAPGARLQLVGPGPG
jgi:hypothetical protein